MSFDYSNTCPAIDDILKTLDREHGWYLNTLTRLIEDVRDENVKMREAADKQIEELEEKIAELEDELKQLTP